METEFIFWVEESPQGGALPFRRVRTPPPDSPPSRGMKLSRDLSGDELARKLARYGYQVTRQVDSHMRLTSTRQGTEYHLTIPRHDPLRPGTLNQILKDVAEYLGRFP